MNELLKLLSDARRQLGYSETLNADGSVRHVMRKPAASVATLSLRALELPAPTSPTGLAAVHAPQGEAAGKVTTLPLAIAQRSRAVTAGARLFLVEPAVAAVPTGSGEIALARRNGRFTVTEPAALVKTPDGDDLVAGTLPFFAANVDLDTMPAYGCHFELSRADQRDYNDGELADAALASLVMGIGRACDAELMAAIVASTPGAFSIGAAAAKGFTLGELRALIGTAGAGASFNASGTLVAGGVVGELTDASTATLIGAWSRAGVAVADDVRVIAERTGKDGALRLTAWVNLQAMLPRAGCFWTAA